MIIYYHLPLLVTEKLPRFAGWRTIRHNCQYIFHWTFTLSTLRSGRVSIYCVSINKGSYPFCAATWNVKLIFLALALRNNRQIIPVFVGRTTNLFSLPTQNNFNPFLFISLPKFIMKPQHLSAIRIIIFIYKTLRVWHLRMKHKAWWVKVQGLF